MCRHYIARTTYISEMFLVSFTKSVHRASWLETIPLELFETNLTFWDNRTLEQEPVSISGTAPPCVSLETDFATPIFSLTPSDAILCVKSRNLQLSNQQCASHTLNNTKTQTAAWLQVQQNNPIIRLHWWRTIFHTNQGQEHGTALQHTSNGSWWDVG